MKGLHRTITRNPKNKKRAKKAQMRARIILSLALITQVNIFFFYTFALVPIAGLQVILQWAWGIFLFVSPNYAQSECSGSTILVFFMVPFTTSSINELDGSHARFLLWPAWILFSLGLTLFLTAYLAKAGSDYSQAEQSSSATMPNSTTPVLRQWSSVLLNSLPQSCRDIDFSDLFVKAVMVGLWALFIASELTAPSFSRRTPELTSTFSFGISD